MGWIRPQREIIQLRHQLAAKGATERNKPKDGCEVSQTEPVFNSSRAPKSRSRADVIALGFQDFRIQPKKRLQKNLPVISAQDVRRRNGKDGNRLWVVVDDTVLDCSEYIKRHPGGKQIIQGFGGQDCTWQWWTFHHHQIWQSVACSLRVGRTEGIENLHVRPRAWVGLRGFGYQDE